MKRPVYVILCVAILIALGVVRHSRQTQSLPTPERTSAVTATEPLPQKLPPMLPPSLTRVASATQTNTPASAPPKSSTKPTDAQAGVTAGGKEGLQDPLARAVLALVGTDPAAEEYWAVAINDPNLSDKEREDLIEDLNEEGFADPENPTLDELPLIVNRLQIIEHYAPSAMDENNARSFAEAYKDLANMFFRLTAQ